MGTLRLYMIEDHRRLDELLERSIADAQRFDVDAFERFRAGLLRHIGIEEKILLPAARRRRGGEPLAIAARLRIEHAAIASLLVPTPDHVLVAEIRQLLAAHNVLEEQEGGLYEDVESLAGDERELLLQRARACNEPPLAPHFDGPTVMRTAAAALAQAESNAMRASARKREV
jgi:hypothetical protein